VQDSAYHDECYDDADQNNRRALQQCRLIRRRQAVHRGDYSRDGEDGDEDGNEESNESPHLLFAPPFLASSTIKAVGRFLLPLWPGTNSLGSVKNYFR
jgi:hypothetical protein